jgi:hypothetical protein
MINDTRFEITPLMILDYGMKFNVTVGGFDVAGNFLEYYTFRFSTGEDIDMTNGDLNVLIIDKSGNSIKGAQITIFPLNNVYIDEHGWVIEIDNLEPGDYEIEVKAEGYETVVIKVTIIAGTSHTEVVVLERSREEEEKRDLTPLIVIGPLVLVIIIIFLAVIIITQRGKQYPEE